VLFKETSREVSVICPKYFPIKPIFWSYKG